MENNTRLLELGDVIYSKYLTRGELSAKYVIDKVTNVYAFSGNKKFKREFTENPEWANIKCYETTDVFNGSYYYFGNDYTHKLYKKKEMLLLINTTKFNDLPFESIEKIFDILIQNGKK